MILCLIIINTGYSQNDKIRYRFKDIPKSYSNIKIDDQANLILENGESGYATQDIPALKTLNNLIGNPQATPTGIYFDFDGALENGSLYYGLINYDDSRFPLPVFFRSPANILDGKAFINIFSLRGRYDMVGWEEKGQGIIGYRVIDRNGDFLYEGRVGFEGKGPFQLDTIVVEGPFINLLTHNSLTLSMDLNLPAHVTIEIGGKTFSSQAESTHHEIPVSQLKPDTEYPYTVRIGNNSESYSFRTAHRPGTRKKFIFSYASDSRSGAGGGERDFYGANAYIMKKIVSLAKYRGSSFIQFTGDLITGYKNDPDEIRLEYANWKRSVEPYARFMPVIPGMGNHEAVMHYWGLPTGEYYSIDKFPFDEVSSEQIFSENFVLPTNGPDSEDGAEYDPSRKTTDFPSYSENVFYYTYDNVAMVVLNSNYWYAPSTSFVDVTSGNIHAFIMDNQVKWLSGVINKLEGDENIDHVFVTVHTPFFPNGGHVNDDMWYGGDNSFRPYINGKPHKKGIIERRDELLDILVNQSKKVVALLTGDEHNYCKTHITPETVIYPSDWDLPKLKLKRSIYQINNGAAGAPYYAQEETPWTPFVSGFTTQNALVLFHVNGKKIAMEVINPDTLDEVDELELR